MSKIARGVQAAKRHASLGTLTRLGSFRVMPSKKAHSPDPVQAQEQSSLGRLDAHTMDLSEHPDASRSKRSSGPLYPTRCLPAGGHRADQ